MAILQDKIDYTTLIDQYYTRNDLISKIYIVKKICSSLQNIQNWDENAARAFKFLLNEVVVPRNWPENKINMDILNGVKFIHNDDVLIDLLNIITPESFVSYEKQFRSLLSNKPKEFWAKIVTSAHNNISKSYLGSDSRKIQKWKGFCDELIKKFSLSVKQDSPNNTGFKILLGIEAALFARYVGKELFKKSNPGGSAY
jgi:hypothetical protein